MSTVTVWLLIAISYGHTVATASVASFPTQAECERVKVLIQGKNKFSRPQLYCEQVTTVK